jgi:DNA-binding transcriptional ArsR family regulator
MEDVKRITAMLKAISDPIRWDIVRQMTEVDELPCQTLEQRLPVSKPTISYHIKILAQAGLLNVRKEGRYFFYALQRDVLRELVDELGLLVPEAVPEDLPGPTLSEDGPGDAGGLASPPSDAARARREPVLMTW